MCIRDSVARYGPAFRSPPQASGAEARDGQSNDDGDHGDQDGRGVRREQHGQERDQPCLLYTSDAADERSSVDLGGRCIIKKKNKNKKKK